MRKPKLHNRIGRSVATLPVCFILALGLWLWPDYVYSHDYAASFAIVLLTGYVILETNNTYQVIRVRSRMMSSVWLFTVACLPFLHPFQYSLVAALCLAASYYLLFRSYQQSQPVVDVFHTFFTLSVGSLILPPMIFLAAFYLWYLAVFMRSLTFRSFFAALVGLLLPFWFWMGWLVWQADLSPFLSWCAELDFAEIDWRLPLQRWKDAPLSTEIYVFLLLTVLMIWTSVYYLLNNYDDKIRSRMMMYIYIIQSVLIWGFSLLTFRMTQYMPLLLVSLTPLVAHYFTLRNTWASLVVFVLTVICFVIIFVNPEFISEYLTTFARI